MKTLLFCLAAILVLLMAAGAGVSQVIGIQSSQELDKVTAIAYYPGLHKLQVRIGTLPPELLVGQPEANVLVSAVGEELAVARGRVTLDAHGGIGYLSLPLLKDGTYNAVISLHPTGPIAITTKTFKQKNFPWEGNTLGITDTIYPPFTPIRVNGKTASVVLRDYHMNGFGLCDYLISEGHNLLAAPMKLVLQTAQGPQQWTFPEAQWTMQKPQQAVYHTRAVSDALEVQTTSTLDYDGCLKVEMTLAPGKTPAEIQSLCLDIPLADKEVPLFHDCSFESLRRAYSGATPRGGKIIWGGRENQGVPPTYRVEPGPGDGVIWTSSNVTPWHDVTVYDFSPYLWLGGAERGLAWFGENDRGWVPAKGKPDQELIRIGDQVILRCHLINKPTTLTAPRTLVFGLQASPTRPMPQNWRANPKIPSHSGAVICWGGYLCASKYPADYDWSVVRPAAADPQE